MAQATRCGAKVDDAASKGRDERAIELSRAGGFVPVGVPYKRLLVAAQVADFDEEKTLEILRRTGYPDVSRLAVAGRLGYARRWLRSFAPEDLRFEVQAQLPDAAADLTADQRRFLAELGSRLEKGMDGQQVHELIYELAGEFPDAKPAQLFSAIYLALLGKPRGPRAGWFLSVLGSELCSARFSEAGRPAS